MTIVEIPDFDIYVSRAGTFAEKIDAVPTYFPDAPADVTPLWVADMDLPAPPVLTRALAARVAHPLYGYTTAYPAVFDAVRWWMRTEHGVEMPADWIRLSPSVVTTMSAVVEAVTRPEEGVVVLSPVYGPFFSVVRRAGRRVVDCPLLVRDGRYAVDWDAVEAACARPEVSLLLWCSPHNPGGRVWSEDEVRRLLAVCRAHQVAVFADEIHSDVVYAPHRHVSVLSVAHQEDRVVWAHSMGKTFNASGLHGSFAAVPHPALRRDLDAVLARRHVDDVNALAKAALCAVLSPDGAAYKRALCAYLRDNVQAVVERLTASGVFAMVPEGTFLVWCDLRPFGPWHRVMRLLLQRAKVALSGGHFFGPAGVGWFRINCAHPRARLLDAVDRMVAALQTAENP